MIESTDHFGQLDGLRVLKSNTNVKLILNNQTTQYRLYLDCNKIDTYFVTSLIN